MNKGLMLAAFAVLLFGVTFAMENASVVNSSNQGRYSYVTVAGNVTTEGGNVTEVNISSNASTEKWVGFYGNVTGNVLLSKGTGTALYVWTWSPAESGEVCVSVNSAFNYWSTLATATATNIDAAFGFTTSADPDTASKTLVDTCSMSFTARGATPISGIGNYTNNYAGNPTWETCAFDRGAESSQGDYVFCVNISSSKTVAPVNANYNYQVMAPISDTPGYTGPYYFYVELE